MKLAITIIFFLTICCSLNLPKRAEQYGTLIKLCDGFSGRDSLINDDDEAETQRFKTTMKYWFSDSGNQLINRLIYTQNDVMQEFTTILQSMKFELGLFVGPFLVGLLLAFLILPFLCCCCCCASNKNSHLYTKCEMMWPSITLILALLLVLVFSFIGLLRASDIQYSYKAVGCSIGIALNDTIFGQNSTKNSSAEGRYFIGLDGLGRCLENLKDKSVDVKSEFDKVEFSNTSSILRATYDEGTALLSSISQIPNGTIGGKMTEFSYNHFDGTAASIFSSFPNTLGSFSNTTSEGAINSSYYALNQVNQGLKTVGINADSFSSQFDTINSTIDQINSQLHQIKLNIDDVDNSLTSTEEAAAPYVNMSTLSIQIFFGVFIGLGSLAMLATVAMTCCHKYSCRYLLYFICILFSILGILLFLFALIFSVITPTLYFSCDFLQVSISSPQNFQNNFQKLLGSEVSDMVQVCVPGGSGDIINQIPGIDLSSINGLTNGIKEMRNYNLTQVEEASNYSILFLQNFIDKNYYTEIFDFDSVSDKSIMNRIANPSNYPQCNFNQFPQDSWVPSLGQTQISCYGTTSTASGDQCPNSSSISKGRNGSSQPTGCFGCMDTTRVLLNSNNIRNDLQNRYDANSACIGWIDQMDNIWNNYYSVKNTNIIPVKQRMSGVKDRYLTPNTGYYVRLTDIEAQFSAIIGSLENIVSSVFDPTYGMIAGLNCLILGEDIQLIINTTCATSFRTIFFLRFALGISAFGILFAMCCISFSGMRAYKQSVGRRDYLDHQEAMMRMPLMQAQH